MVFIFHSTLIMRYFITILCLFLFAWCSSNNQSSFQGNSKPISGLSSQIQESKYVDIQPQNIFLNWMTASWFSITWTYHTIYLSWQRLIYVDTFSIEFPITMEKWEYYDMYSENFTLANIYLSQTIHISAKEISINENNPDSLCTYNFEEWLISKQEGERVIQWIAVKYFDGVFSLSGPDVVPQKSWQKYICFVRDNIVYRISVSDNKKYRSDILNSLKFF
jgi:hypothetical protein